MAKRRGSFFGSSTPEDMQAREREVAALLAPRRTVVQDLPLERIGPNPFQARKQFENLEELAEAIRQQGFTSRLRVRPAPESGHFQLVYGERRLRAARLAGLASVPCEIAEHTDAEMVEIGLAENIQRRDLAPLEEAEAFQTFITERGYSIRKLAERIGKDKGYVENRLYLLRVPEDIQEMVLARPDTLRAARELARLPDAAARAPLIEALTSGALSSQDVQALVREGGGAVATAPPVPRLPNLQRSLERDLRTMHALVARWEEQATLLNPQGQATLREGIQALLHALEQLQRKVD